MLCKHHKYNVQLSVFFHTKQTVYIRFIIHRPIHYAVTEPEKKSNLRKIWERELSVYVEKNLAQNDLYDIGWDKNLAQCKKKNMEPDSCHLMSH